MLARGRTTKHNRMKVKHVTRRGKGVAIHRIPSGSGKPSRSWYRRIKRGGKNYYFDLGTELGEAEKAADAIDALLRLGKDIEELMFEYDHKTMRRAQAGQEGRSSGVTCGDLCTVALVKGGDADLKPKTITDYRNKFGHWVKCCGLGGDDWRDVLLSDLCASRAEAYKRNVAGKASAGGKAGESLRVSYNSTIGAVKAMFGEHMLRLYRDNGLEVPDMAWVKGLEKFRKVDKATRFVPPSPEVLEGIITLGRGWRESDPAKYVVWLLGLGCGLRRGEMEAARASWLVEPGGNPSVHVQAEDGFSTKSRQSRVVAISRSVWKELRQVANDGSLLHLDRPQRMLNNEVNAALRACGLREQKPVHELRKIFGCMVATRDGIFHAQMALGHSSPQVTTDHYAQAVVQPEMINLWEQMVPLEKHQLAFCRRWP